MPNEGFEICIQEEDQLFPLSFSLFLSAPPFVRCVVFFVVVNASVSLRGGIECKIVFFFVLFWSK